MTVKMKICKPEMLPDKLRSIHSDTEDCAVHDNGMIYLKLCNSIFSCPDDQAGRELVYNILLSCRAGKKRLSGRESLFYRIVNDRQFIPEADTLKKLRINPTSARCIIIFQSAVHTSSNLYDIISEIAPMEDSDIIIPVNYHSAALIRDMDRLSMDELVEYAEAVIGTMESEGIDGIKAGIGNEANDLFRLTQCYDEGMKALETGMKSHSRSNVFLYSGQILERILNSIPEDRRSEIRNTFFKNNNTGYLSDEMLETVRVFFLNDLNLTAASKQLFIHRNTLNYRLDKIKKDTGLDLRSFEDAVIFRIIMEMRN